MKKTNSGGAYIIVIVAVLVVLTVVTAVLCVTAASRDVTARYGDFFGMYDLAAAGNERAFFIIQNETARYFEETRDVTLRDFLRARINLFNNESEIVLEINDAEEFFYLQTTVRESGGEFYIETKIGRGVIFEYEFESECIVRSRVNFLDDNTVQMVELFRIAD
jgi:hypothetical protein